MFNDDDELCICPYNRSHIVSKSRFQLHVVKCKQNYPKDKLITCFYNYTHKVKHEDIINHYETCPNKIRSEDDSYLLNLSSEKEAKLCPKSVALPRTHHENFKIQSTSRKCEENNSVEPFEKFLSCNTLTKQEHAKPSETKDCDYGEQLDRFKNKSVNKHKRICPTTKENSEQSSEIRHTSNTLACDKEVSKYLVNHLQSKAASTGQGKTENFFHCSYSKSSSYHTSQNSSGDFQSIADSKQNTSENLPKGELLEINDSSPLRSEEIDEFGFVINNLD